MKSTTALDHNYKILGGKYIVNQLYHKFIIRKMVKVVIFHLPTYYLLNAKTIASMVYNIVVPSGFNAGLVHRSLSGSCL